MVKVVENGERICTVTLDGSESSIVFQNDYKYFAVKNESNAAVYVSLTRGIVEGADGVMTIGSKESALFAHMKPHVNMFFVKGTGTIQVFASNTPVNPFKSAPAQSGGGTTVDSYSKTESDARYAQKTDIPSSLPANGGNADTVDGLHANDFARSYSDELKAYLNGQSGDIRALVYQLPIGEYALSTTDSEYSGITFPIQGYCLISWFPSKSSANDFMYGTLIIRPMSYVGATYICSVYNTYSYTDWEQISTTPIKKMTFSSVATNQGGGGSLFPADFGTPITIACTSRRDTQCTPFLADIDSGKLWLVLAKDTVTLDSIPAGSYSFDVWYI